MKTIAYSLLVCGLLIDSGLYAQAPASMQESAAQAQSREFERLLTCYSDATNAYSRLFNEVMPARGVVWNRKQAAELIRLRRKADQAWDKLISTPTFQTGEVGKPYETR